MRTIEVIIVITIITTGFILASFFAVLPAPRQVSPLNLRQLALTTLQALDQDYALSEIVFKPSDDPSWSMLHVALAACLPPNIVYNLTVYEIKTYPDGTVSYVPVQTLSNAKGGLGVRSDAASYLVASSNVTFRVIPEKIGEHGGGGTLYILNCSDANGWWITGYTAQSLANDLYNMLSPYFQRTVVVQTTTQFGLLLNGSSLEGETLQDAVVINTFGEAVPIPAGYYTSQGYDSARNSYAKYCYILGQRVRQYNWMWVSIVGYPLYYVTNTGFFTGSNDHNSWGIYGMKEVGAAGFNAFLQGLDERSYTYDNTWLTGNPGVVYLSSEASYYSNYYGIYPAPYQTSSRALPTSILSTYHLTVSSYIFNPVGNWIPGAVYRHNVSGSFLALGLARTPDVRVTALGLLSYYKPRLYRSEYVVGTTSRLIVLQLGQIGG
jgi:hypothetical protein